MLAEHGLYVDSLIYEIEYQDIKFDENYRKQLEEKADKEGLENLYNMAKKIDEEAVKKISPNDKKRILRILEIYHATGKNKTWQEQESRKNPVEYDYKVFAINWDREKLYERINKNLKESWMEYMELKFPKTDFVFDKTIKLDKTLKSDKSNKSINYQQLWFNLKMHLLESRGYGDIRVEDIIGNMDLMEIEEFNSK